MCRKKYYDALAVGVSILIGIALSLLVTFDLLTSAFTAPVVGAALGGLSLLMLTIAAASLLQQNNTYNDCMCRSARRVLLAAIALLVFSIFSIAFTVFNVVAQTIFNFLVFSLISYALFSLYCWFKCLLSVGCDC